jgi:type II secretory pathway component PulK
MTHPFVSREHPMTRTLRNERGIALVLVLLIAIAVTALAMGGIVMSSSGSLTSKFHYKEFALQSSADGGSELARDSLNRNSAA